MTSMPRRLRATLHELSCAECRVTWKSWGQRLLGIRAGMWPEVKPRDAP